MFYVYVRIIDCNEEGIYAFIHKSLVERDLEIEVSGKVCCSTIIIVHFIDSIKFENKLFVFLCRICIFSVSM